MMSDLVRVVLIVLAALFGLYGLALVFFSASVQAIAIGVLLVALAAATAVWMRRAGRSA